MSHSTSRLPQSTCHGKVGYSFTESTRFAKWARRKDRDRWRNCQLYRCPHCSSWHFGHSLERESQRSRRSRNATP